ncbi:UDP-N-acetylmuramoyl-tripeptide--D-alanyl-D-alanine ligase [Succinimonas amylolytica]|uniref:UDP-N-acetylmuramoyl-tripeptide--D-alanyl-D- alanine ligase n=1 Tax=Succinimonas amylolytica TaxID=83769 RepID=UPI0003712008|nr:UDP-N-acetylmuramoyl-tripeptide--D-alanyl-D-alanine ligase [Succinimonas amylolytica]
MIEMTLAEIAAHVGGKLFNAEDQAGRITISGVETDSRRDVRGMLFVCLRGENFDGHDFAKEVCSKGAVALLADHELPVEAPQIVVPDTLRGLGLLGQLNRRKSHARVVAVTGTCGKTTVKEMTAAILSRMGNTIATKGNFNNSVGVPLTLLTINSDTDYAVIELGASHPGDIAWTVEFAEPEAALINNVGGAHLEGFGGFDGVYRAKSEILDYVFSRDSGKGVVNADSEFYDRWKSDYAGKDLMGFGTENDHADVRAVAIRSQDNGTFAFRLITPQGEGDVRLALPGRHNVANALAAAALSGLAGAGVPDIIEGLEAQRPVPGRLFVEKLGTLTLIDDSYNASFNAVQASLDTLSLLPGYRVFVFGDMGELGQDAPELHARIGVYARGRVDEFWSIGDLAALSARSFGGRVFESREELLDAVRELVNRVPDLTIAAKGSHAMKMGDVADLIRSMKG